MAKFRIRLKLQALELEIDGEREDIPAIASAVQQQFAGLIQPAEAMANDHKQLPPGPTIDASNGTGKKTPSRKRSSGRPAGDGIAGQALEFRHDSVKYGSPQQSWTNTEKCIWLLAVIKGVTGTKEVSGPQIAATFNQHFKQAGKVHPPLVSRELGKAKIQTPAPVGEDRGIWFLTDEGDRQAQALIQGVLNPIA